MDININQNNDKAFFKYIQQTFLALKKDPQLYKQEVQKIANQFQQLFLSVTTNTTAKNQKFVQVAIFLAQVAHIYRQGLSFLGTHLQQLLKIYGTVLQPYMRKKTVSCLFILRAKNLLLPVQTLKFLLGLLNIKDKILRRLIMSGLINDIKRINKHKRNSSINKRMQTAVQQIILKQQDTGTRKALKLAIDLYFRGYWRDDYTINLIGSGCFNPNYKVKLAAAYFLLSTTKPPDLDSDSQEQEDPFQIRFKKGKTKKTKAKLQNLQKRKKRLIKKRQKKLESQGQNLKILPIDQIYNPQLFVQKLFSKLQSKQQKFSVKLVFMGVMSRMIRRHRLILPAFFNYLSKYIDPAQKQLVKILISLAESVHPLTQPKWLQGVLNILLNKIISQHCSQQCMTMGINCLRQILTILPDALDQDQVRYLCTFYQYKNKNVSSSAKSVINILRAINRQILPTKYKGRANQQQNSKNQVSLVQGAVLLGQGQDILLNRILDDDDWKKIRNGIRKGFSNQQQQLDWQDAQILEEDDQSCQQQQQNSQGWRSVNSQQDQQCQDYEQNEQQQQYQQQKQIQQSQQQYQQEQQQKGNKFIDEADIGYYKHNKKDSIAIKQKETKMKMSFAPKQKGGGTTNKQKIKNKPLMMMRQKKKKQQRHIKARQRVKQIENRIRKHKKRKY